MWSARPGTLKPIADVVSVSATRPDDAVIARAAQIIRRGGLVVFPTLGLYGLGADPFSAAAVERIFAVKGRQTRKALLVLIADRSDIERVAIPPDRMARELMHRFWPGRVTFVLHARKGLPAALTASGDKIGVRLVAHPVAAALVRAVGAPVTGTSANISGSGGCASIEAMESGLLNGVDLVLNAGPLAGGPGSTIVDVTGPAPLILREGAVPAEEIRKVFNETQY
jgi:L-threonylcarbamoyladenylate synthase